MENSCLLHSLGSTKKTCPDVQTWLSNIETDALVKEPHFVISETPRFIGRGIAALAGDPNVARWRGKSASIGELARIYGVTDLDGSQPDAWRNIVEVQEAGKPANADGYC